MLTKTAHYLVCLLFFIIPAIWWTRLNANYYSTKLSLFFLAGALAWLAIPSKITLPKFPRIMLISLLVIIFLQLVKHTYTFSFDNFLHFGKFLSFIALVFWLYSRGLALETIYEKTTYVLLLTALFILGVSSYEFFQFRIINQSLDLGLVSTFGNINMTAEYLVLTVPFLFYWTRFKDKTPQWLKLAVFSFWLFFILYCRSRSAWIGLALWLILQFRYKISKKEFMAITTSLLLYFAAEYMPAKESRVGLDKLNSGTQRLALYVTTFEMIKDYPWGIPAGSYLSEVEPYLMQSTLKPSEFNYYDQPHSEFLKWGVQFGWVFLAASMVFIFSILFYLAKWFWLKKNSYFVETFAVLLPQLLFQFPFENPASLLYLSLPLALFFKEFYTTKIINIHFSYRPLMYILFLAGLYNSVGFVNSVYQESTIPRNEKIIAACDYYPINIKACHAKLGYYIDNKKFDRFLAEFKVDFVKYPFFVDYLKLLPTYYSLKLNNKKSCQALFLYETIFPLQKSFEAKYYENCKGFPNIFYFDEPQKFKTRYLTWLDL